MTEPHIEHTEDKEIISFDRSKFPRGVAWDWIRRHRQDTFAPYFNPWRAGHFGDRWKWSRNKSLKPPEPQPPEELDVPDPKVWYQVSRKFRQVARLPEGMTPQQALLWAKEEYAKLFEDEGGVRDWEREEILKESDWGAKLTFLRTYTCYPFAQHLHRELSMAEFAEFRKQGGRSI